MDIINYLCRHLAVRNSWRGWDAMWWDEWKRKKGTDVHPSIHQMIINKNIKISWKISSYKVEVNEDHANRGPLRHSATQPPKTLPPVFVACILSFSPSLFIFSSSPNISSPDILDQRFTLQDCEREGKGPQYLEIIIFKLEWKGDDGIALLLQKIK